MCICIVAVCVVWGGVECAEIAVCVVCGLSALYWSEYMRHGNQLIWVHEVLSLHRTPPVCISGALAPSAHHPWQPLLWSSDGTKEKCGHIVLVSTSRHNCQCHSYYLYTAYPHTVGTSSCTHTLYMQLPVHSVIIFMPGLPA